MTDSGMVLLPIGVIHSEHGESKGMSAYPPHVRNARGIAEIYPEYATGLPGLESCSHLYLIYRHRQPDGGERTVPSFASDAEPCISTTRSPCSPNRIGLSFVELILWQGNLLHLRGDNLPDGAPILDIKPCHTKSGSVQAIRNDWLGCAEIRAAKQAAIRGGSA